MQVNHPGSNAAVLASDNRRLRWQMKVVIATREVARSYLEGIVDGCADPAARAQQALDAMEDTSRTLWAEYEERHGEDDEVAA